MFGILLFSVVAKTQFDSLQKLWTIVKYDQSSLAKAMQRTNNKQMNGRTNRKFRKTKNHNANILEPPIFFPRVALTSHLFGIIGVNNHFHQWVVSRERSAHMHACLVFTLIERKPEYNRNHRATAAEWKLSEKKDWTYILRVWLWLCVFVLQRDVCKICVRIMCLCEINLSTYVLNYMLFCYTLSIPCG